MLPIDDLHSDDQAGVAQAAALLVDAFREHAPAAWPDHASALDEVREALAPGRICRAARLPGGAIAGWVGGIPEYGGHVLKLHPLVVRPDLQGRGIGRALVADLERQAAARGIQTLFLGTDDETNRTSLAGADLYPDVWPHIAAIRNLRGHPYEFYRKCGFTIVGVLPDANGRGRPDIFMAKRVGAYPEDTTESK